MRGAESFHKLHLCLTSGYYFYYMTRPTIARVLFLVNEVQDGSRTSMALFEDSSSGVFVQKSIGSNSAAVLGPT